MEELLWQSDQGDDTYENPVLFADYSDPDAIRVGDTYYMTASSFNYTPGLPILISRDLVNWELVNYATGNIPYPMYQIPQHSKGIWAPAIRFHEGKFYIYYGMPDEGIFMVSTEDPLGKWSKPQIVLDGKGLIDPCPFWDENHHAYVIHGYAKSRIGFKSYLGIFEMSQDGTHAISEDKILYNGVETQPTIEGPKVYKRNGYYYIFAPAGGVVRGWQTVLRSQNIQGPFEERIVMRQLDSLINGPHQGALVDTRNGEEWFLHFQDKGFYGRITHLQPVVWKDDWPIIGINEGHNGHKNCGKPCLRHKKPNTGMTDEITYLHASDNFAANKLGLQWQWMGNSSEDFYSLTEKENTLRLYAKNVAKDEDVTLWRCPNVLTQKLLCPYFTAEVTIAVSALEEGEQAGLVMFGGQYAGLNVSRVKNRLRIAFFESEGSGAYRKESVAILAELKEPKQQVRFMIKMKNNDNSPSFGAKYRIENGDYVDVVTNFMPADDTWVGAKLGLFTTTLHHTEGRGYADFSGYQVSRI